MSANVQREWRQLALRAERKAQRAEPRKECEQDRRRAEEHAPRKARFDAGGPYWTDEEWEKL